jgi:Flp pilus assembly protein TadD
VTSTRFPRLRALHPAAYVFAACFLLRLIVLAQLTSTGAVVPSGSDMAFYNEWALRIVRGEWADGQAFYGLPGYPFFVAGLYRIFGYNTFVPALLQIALDSGTAALIYNIATRICAGGALLRAGSGSAAAAAGGWSVAGVVGAGAWALFVPAQAYSVILMPNALLTFAFWWLVWQVVITSSSVTLRRALLWGVVLGVAAMFVATILFLVPLLALAALLRNGTPPRRAAAVLLLLVGVVAGASPAWLHNALVARDPVFLSAHSGVNFWLGNNPEATGYPNFPAELRAGQSNMLHDSIAVAERATGRTLPRSEVSAYWSARAHAYIASEPAAWLQLLMVKLRNFWSAFQYDDTAVIDRLQEDRVLLPGFTFGIVASLGLPGLCFAAWRIPGARWVLGAVFCLMCAVLMVFVTERYRLAAVPGLLIGVGYGLAALWQSVVQHRYSTVIGYPAACFVVAFAIATPPQRPQLWALPHYSAALRAIERGDLARAEEQISRALAYVPDSTEAQFALGNVRLQQRDLEAARQRYEQVLRQEARHVGALHNLGVISLEQGEFAGAERLFREALIHDPHSAVRHFLRARALLGLGDRASARAAVRQALQLQPNQPEFEQLLQELD